MNEKIDDGDIIARREVDTTGCRSYIEIPFRSSRIESSCLIDVLANIAKDGRKVGIPNRTEKENYTRNPDVGMIGKIRRRGFKL
jgi:methionyl-tRNA formyltransferase